MIFRSRSQFRRPVSNKEGLCFQKRLNIHIPFVDQLNSYPLNSKASIDGLSSSFENAGSSGCGGQHRTRSEHLVVGETPQALQDEDPGACPSISSDMP